LKAFCADKLSFANDRFIAVALLSTDQSSSLAVKTVKLSVEREFELLDRDKLRDALNTQM